MFYQLQLAFLLCLVYSSIVLCNTGNKCQPCNEENQEENVIELPANLQGSPGKKGPKGDMGDTGLPGPQGPPGTIDYEEVESRINVILENELSTLDGMQSKLTKVESETTELHKIVNLKNGGLCDVYYDGICYVAVLTTSTYSSGVDRCRKIGGQAANIYDKTHHELIVKYIRAKHMVDRTHTQLWIGMTINLQSGTVYFRNMERPRYIRWLEGEPNRPGKEPNLGIHVAWGTDGILDLRPRTNRHGVLCEL